MYVAVPMLFYASERLFSRVLQDHSHRVHVIKVIKRVTICFLKEKVTILSILSKTHIFIFPIYIYFRLSYYRLLYIRATFLHFT